MVELDKGYDSLDEDVKKVKDFLLTYSDAEIIMLKQAIENNFIVRTNPKGEITSKDWKNSREIFSALRQLIAINIMGDCIEGEGCVKGRVFLRRYVNRKAHTEKDIWEFFIQNRLPN